MKELISPFISNGMVMQRDVPFPVWSKKNITINFLGKIYKAQPLNGKFLITIDPAEAGGPYEMEISSDSGSVVIKDIYYGDLWLCSGQSNMEMQMDRLHDDFNEEWLIKDYPLVRQFKVPQEWDFSAPREDLTGGSWIQPSKERLSEFGATPWFFAKNLYEKYKIPIGLVMTAWGGTPVESWMSDAALADFPEKIAEGKQYASEEKRNEIAATTGAAIQKWETNLSHDDEGKSKKWENPQTDISSWDEIKLPGNFSDAGLVNFSGVIWLAKEFDVSAGFASQDAKVWLGTIVDSDTVYINGTEIGNTGYRYPPRKYIPNNLIKQGKNRIVIRVVCNNGEGGVTSDKPFRIFTDKESAELSGTWKYKTGAKAQTRPNEFFFQRMPMGNYNAMIAPVLKFPFKGVIWYQGESNESAAHEYNKLFCSMIKDWRKNNGSELPFLFVQLPIFCPVSDNYEQAHWAVLREAQAQVLSLPATGMAAALELGEWNDIHPINKKDVGYRLFLAAEKTLFGVKNTSPGPMLQNFELLENKILLHFNNCGIGLNIDAPSSDAYFSVIGTDGQVRLPGKIENNDTISIDISSVKNPKKVLYAWADNPRDRQLFNSDGLPVIPFRIELP
ncbi:MAG: hypothetical protein FWD22_00400 [Treponema sp.]|nr:hypothetical protein [Treponema sp.]